MRRDIRRKLWLVSQLKGSLLTTNEGQWIYYTIDCKCLKVTSWNLILDTNYGWFKTTEKDLILNYNLPAFNTTYPNDGIQWRVNIKDCKCFDEKTCEETGPTLKCGWCPTLQRGLSGNTNGLTGKIACPPTNLGQWTYELRNCECPKVGNH